jgi:hypothetical protein
VSPVKYELCFYIPADDILHSHRRENLKSYMTLECYSETIRWLANPIGAWRDCQSGETASSCKLLMHRTATHMHLRDFERSVFQEFPGPLH